MSLYLRDADGSLAPDEAGWGTGKGGLLAVPCPYAPPQHVESAPEHMVVLETTAFCVGAVRVCVRAGGCVHSALLCPLATSLSVAVSATETLHFCLF